MTAKPAGQILSCLLGRHIIVIVIGIVIVIVIVILIVMVIVVIVIVTVTVVVAVIEACLNCVADLTLQDELLTRVSVLMMATLLFTIMPASNIDNVVTTTCASWCYCRVLAAFTHDSSVRRTCRMLLGTSRKDVGSSEDAQIR